MFRRNICLNSNLKMKITVHTYENICYKKTLISLKLKKFTTYRFVYTGINSNVNKKKLNNSNLNIKKVSILLLFTYFDVVHLSKISRVKIECGNVNIYIL